MVSCSGRMFAMGSGAQWLLKTCIGSWPTFCNFGKDLESHCTAWCVPSNYSCSGEPKQATLETEMTTEMSPQPMTLDTSAQVTTLLSLAAESALLWLVSMVLTLCRGCGTRTGHLSKSEQVSARGTTLLSLAAESALLRPVSRMVPLFRGWQTSQA